MCWTRLEHSIVKKIVQWYIECINPYDPFVSFVRVLMPPRSLGAGACSTDGESWEVIDHQEAQSCHDGDFIEYQMEAPTQAQFFRFQFTEGEGGNSNGSRLREIKFLYCSC